MIDILYSPGKICSLLDYNTTHFSGNYSNSTLPKINFEYSRIETGFEIVSIDILSSMTVKCTQESDPYNKTTLLYFLIDGLAISQESIPNPDLRFNQGMYVKSSKFPGSFENISHKGAKGYIIALSRNWLLKEIPDRELRFFCIQAGKKVRKMLLEDGALKLMNCIENSVPEFSNNWHLTSVGWLLINTFFSQLKYNLKISNTGFDLVSRFS